MVQAIVRLFSYAFHLLLSLAALGVGLVAALSDNTTFQFEFLPWSGKELQNWLLALGAIGLVSVALAFKGKVKFLFLAWSVVAAGLIARGIFLSGYRFEGEADFKWALGILGCALISAWGAWNRARR
ncbi:MAG: hypothetical protein FJW38_07895 [Acidobacteria bacterium]|nr:hypothetical protein [Acidobacteriota bacterium]